MQQNSVFRFSTDDLPVKDRLPIWREVMGRQHMRLDIEPHDPSEIWAAIDVYRLPAAEITYVQSDPAIYTRTRQLARDGNGDFTFTSIEHAGFHATSDKSDEELGPRDAALLSHSVSGMFDVPSRARVLAARLDGNMMRHAVRDLDERLVHRMPSNNPVLRLVVSYIESIIENDLFDNSAVAFLINTHLVDLIALCLRPTNETRERARADAIPAARLATIRADIAANLSQVRLSAKTIAQRQGISERYVYLLFEQSGSSFSRFITEERLKRALAMLLDPACAVVKISDIAFAVGFGDLTTFNRSFRRRYGDTPRVVRAQAKASKS